MQAEAKVSSTPQLNEAFVFPQGIAGFPDATRFGFIYEGVGEMVCMQCVDHLEAAFILTPWDEARLGKPPELSEEQCRCLEIDDTADVMWMLVLNPFADSEWVTANLKAPIALSMSTQRGFQLIRHEPQYELRFHWMPQPVEEPEKRTAE